MFKDDPRVFEIRIFESYGGLWYDIRHPGWGTYKLDSRPISQMLTLWGGILAHCVKKKKAKKVPIYPSKLAIRKALSNKPA